MAKKSLITIGSSLEFVSVRGGDDCVLCASRAALKWSVQYDYATEKVIDWTEDRDFDDHGEVYVCAKCADKFDHDVLIG
jgi:hypothetical protein